MKSTIANYVTEQDYFHKLLLQDVKHRILMFHGQSGTGKTTLLNFCLSNAPEHILHVAIQLRNNDTTVGNILYRIGRRVNWSRMPRLVEQIAILQGSPGSQHDLAWLASIRTHISQVLNAETPDERYFLRACLTDSCFMDLQNLASTFLLVFDTYEQANREIEEWLTQQVFPWIVDSRNMRIVLAGQVVPELNAEWGHCCLNSELLGIHEAKAWLSVAEALDRVVPSLDFLNGACTMANGNPSQISAFIQLLGKKNNHTTLQVNREELHKQLVATFNEDELIMLCFDINLNYEDLSGGSRQTKIVSLIQYMERRGRLQELLQICQVSRPNWV